jgi:hypothetical protein
MAQKNGERQFLETVFWLLIVTGSAKLVSAFEGARLLARYDPVLPLSLRETLLLAAAVEFGCAVVVRVPRLTRISCLLVACLGGQFVLYHLAAHMTGMPGPCPCLGSVAAWTGLSDKSARIIVVAIAIYFVLGGMYFYLSSDARTAGEGSNRHSSAPSGRIGTRRHRYLLSCVAESGGALQTNSGGSPTWTEAQRDRGSQDSSRGDAPP